MSAFVLKDGVVYQTYSAYSRGLAAYGACISGSTARRSVATRTASGGSGTMNMISEKGGAD